MHLICIQCPAKRGDSRCGGNEILTLGSNCLGGILTFEANTSASYCLCILTLPVPSQLSSCTGITSPLWSMSRLLGFSQFPSAYKPNLGTRWPCPNIPETDTRCTRTQSGEPEKIGQEARNQSPASSRHSGGEGPLPPPVLAASFLTKPPPTPTSWGPGGHLELSPNCHVCLASKIHPCGFLVTKTLLADVTGALRGALLCLARSAGREKGSPDNQMHLQFLFCVGYKATFFFFLSPVQDLPLNQKKNKQLP